MLLIKVNTISFLYDIAMVKGKYEQALALSLSLLDLAIKNSNDIYKAKAYNNIGMAQFRLCAYDEALKNCSLALNTYDKIDDKLGYAKTSGNIGLIYDKLGAYDKYLEYQTISLVTHEKIGNKLGVALVLGNIGPMYIFLGSYEKAEEYIHKAIAIFEEIKNEPGLITALGNLGIIFFKLKKYHKALEYFLLANEKSKRLGNKLSIAINTGNIGNVYSEIEEYDKAEEYCNKALTIHEEIENKYGVALSCCNMGQIYANEKFIGYDLIKAEEFLKKGLQISKEIGAKPNLLEVYQLLSNLYEQEKKVVEALEYYKKYHELEKEVQSEEATKQAQQLENRRKVEEAERDRQVKLARFQEQEKILLNILPAQIAERILEGEKQIADLHEHVSVFFSDIVGFTQLSQKITPDELLSMLNEIFSEFDRIARKHGLEKIKTIGDAYMAVAGVPIDCEDHAEMAAAFALDVIEYMKVYRQTNKSELQIRVGLHTGRAIAGVIGENKFAYDLWGDSVNTASRMESHGEAGKIHVSEDFRDALSESSYNFIERGEMEVKGKGKMKTYFLEF